MKTFSASAGRCAVLLLLAAAIVPASARNPIRSAFFSTYPAAVGTQLDNLPNKPGHCGVCHYDFNGGGTRNLYGGAVESVYNANGKNAAAAISAVRGADPDADGFSTDTEVTNTVSYANTPTFPGLSTANTNLVSNISVALIQNYLIPSAANDLTLPVVQVTFPNGGQTLVANRFTNVTWTVMDASPIAAVHLFVSLDNGTTYQQIGRDVGSSPLAWVPADRPTTQARIKVVATDAFGNVGSNVSSSAFTIVSPPFTNVHGVATTLRDFDMPGTQPFEHGPDLPASANCASCHGNYNPAVEPYFNWAGSMMANASRDLLFQANMTIANQDAANSGDLCLRCHLPRGWLAGRSVPTDGSRMQAADRDGVTCALCHGLVDPNYNASLNPTNDLAVLAALSFPGTNYGNGMYVVDPTGVRRGPYTNATLGHNSLGAPFHRAAAFCGTCHDVSNPAFQNDGAGNYSPNSFDAPASTFSPHGIAPVERTYSEWLHSDYAQPDGVFAPQFAGNRPDGRVSTCQHCHMRSTSGYVANPAGNAGIAERPDVGRHDFAGGSAWMTGLLTNLYPTEVDQAAIAAGVTRSIQLLTNAATLAVADADGQFKIWITNECGHKLPTGYPEGRRIWLNVKFYDESEQLLGESGAYDFNTGELTRDAAARIYEVHPGLETNLAGLLTLPPGPSLHFVLNNRIYEDNRIPPRGFTNAAFATFGGAPVGHYYADGQYWDEANYALPTGATRAEVKLYYQSTSKEFVEFLRDKNHTDSKGLELYQVWSTNGMCPPTLIAASAWVTAFQLKSARFTSQGAFRIEFLCRPGLNYTIEYADSLPAVTWQAFVANGSYAATTTTGSFEDDFTPQSSGAVSSTGARFYRIRYSIP
jgi:hypothetical protein